MHSPSALNENKWPASHSFRFTPTRKTTGTHWIGGRVDPRAGLDAVKRGISYPCQESNPNSLVVHPPDSSYTSPPEQLLTKLSSLVKYEVML
jgi:hypothetical protein